MDRVLTGLEISTYFLNAGENYVYQYFYEDENGCANMAELNVVFDICTSIEELSKGQLLVYPNPTSGIITIENSK